MSKKDISEFDPSCYASYAVTKIKEDFKIYLIHLHPTDLIEYLDYDFYDIGEYNLIAFTNISFHKTDFVYRVISENFTEDIQSENYEFLYDVLEGSYDKSKHVFYIMKSSNPLEDEVSGMYDPVDPLRKCPTAYQAVGFQDITIADGKPFILDTKYITNENIRGWTVFLTSISNIYIVKVSFNHIDEEAYREWAACTLMGSTFPYVMKLAYEWSIANSEPWNNHESVAIRCKNAFDEWDIPKNVIEEINQSQPQTPLSLFLSGDPNPRRSIEENFELTPLFKNWFISKIRYRTLKCMQQNHPGNLQIPDDMIEKEKKFFEKELYSFCMKHYLNTETVTSIEILDKAYFDKSYIEVNNSIGDIIKKSPYLKDISAIREYEKNKEKPHDTRTEVQ